ARHFRDMPAGPGRHVDDRAFPLLTHRRQHRTHAIEHTVEIDIYELVPAFQLHVGPAPLRHVHAGAVDLEIDAAGLCEDLIGDLPDMRGPADIEGNGLGLSPGLFDLFDARIQRRLAAP